MRHLFVPACLCLITLPGLTAKEPRLSLDYLSGLGTIGEAVSEETAPATATIPEDLASLGGESTRDKTESDADNDSAPSADDGFDPAAALDDAEMPPPPPPLPPKPKPVVERSRAEICDTVTRSARLNNVPVPFFISLLFQESRFQPGVVSSAGAEGIAQFMPETSAEVGLKNPFDPAQAIPAAARLLGRLVQQFGNFGLAAAAYNAGPRRIQDWLTNKGKLPQETQGYVKTITGRAPETFTTAAKGIPAMKLPRRAPCQEAAGLLAWNGPDHIPLPPQKDAARLAEHHRGKQMQAKKAEKPARHGAKKVAAAKGAAPAADKTAPVRHANAANAVAARHHAHRAEKVAQN